MAVRTVLKLGNPQLYEVCVPVMAEEVASLRPGIQDLDDTLLAFRARYGAGRAIAAPQIGCMKRIVYMNLPSLPAGLENAVSAWKADARTYSVVFLNPTLTDCSEEMIELWDDCMCFPDLLVKVRRHESCRIVYRDLDWAERAMPLQGDLSELLQHEVDHLDGVLATMRAVDGRSFALRKNSIGRIQN